METKGVAWLLFQFNCLRLFADVTLTKLASTLKNIVSDAAAITSLAAQQRVTGAGRQRRSHICSAGDLF